MMVARRVLGRYPLDEPHLLLVLRSMAVLGRLSRLTIQPRTYQYTQTPPVAKAIHQHLRPTSNPEAAP